MSIHISRPAIEKCYAVMWSYGQICVNSGCCKRGAYAARLRYHKEQLAEDEAKLSPDWSGWAHESPDLKALQERSIKANIKHEKRKIRELEKKLKAQQEREARSGGRE